jgi:hypothetical protein
MSKNNKESINEGLFGTLKTFSDAFFDGLKTNATNAALDRAKRNKLPKDLIDAMEQIERDGDEFIALLKKYDKK